MFYYHHPESGSIWSQETPLTEEETDGLVEQLTREEYRQMKKDMEVDHD